MSFSKEKKQAIKDYLLTQISTGNRNAILKTAEVFHTSRQTVYKYLHELEENGAIHKEGKEIQVVSHIDQIHIPIEKGKTDEDRIFDENIMPLIKQYEDNVIHMWYFCFTEMMNNVIDHSEASNCTIIVIRNPVYTEILLSDDGIGIFHKITEHFHYPTPDDAIVELFKGKLTTDSQNHSGEGIFFTSRIMDVFAAISDGKLFSHSDYHEVKRDLDDIPQLKSLMPEKGTLIYMQLSNHSRKTNKDIMDTFADQDKGFTRTRIPVKNLFNAFPVSRSQAKRLYNRLDSFETVELDFTGVEEIGQGFAHELFVVFQRNHPETRLIPYNVCFDVQRMINHVLSTR